MAHHGPILLFDMRLVILLVGSRTGKGDLLGKAIAVEGLIDKFTAVVRIQAQQRKGQVVTQLHNGLRDG